LLMLLLLLLRLAHAVQADRLFAHVSGLTRIDGALQIFWIAVHAILKHCLMLVTI